MMPLARAVEILAVIQLGLMGLSHILRHRAWAEFFIQLRGLGYSGVFVHGFLSLAFGALVLGFHRVWSGIPAVLSVVGVLYLAKTLQCFLFPGVALRSLERVSLERSWVFAVPGAAFLAVAATLMYGLVRGAP
jgi:hypothetical protein